MRAFWFPLLTALILSAPASGQDISFSWDHATVYRLSTDRFSNGDADNDVAYGRGLDGDGSAYAEDPSGHFMGGDYAGIQGWLEEGYFDDLGVNVLWLSAPYEQVQGWVGGGDGDFQLYAYEAAWPFDYTSFERAFGGAEALSELAREAERRDMRIVVDVDLNHVGPPTMHDMAAYGFGGLTGEGWRSWQPSSRLGWQSYQSDLVTTQDSLDAWQRWWGKDWVRADIVGYEPCGSDALTRCIGGLPDLRSDIEVGGLPPFLVLKWGAEGAAVQQAELDAFFERTDASRTASNHVVKWLVDWVRKAPLDGFHVREADGIAPDVLALLTREVGRAYSERHTESGTETDHPFLLLHDGRASVPASTAQVEWRSMTEHMASENLPADVQATLPEDTDQVSGLPFRTLSEASAAMPGQAASFLLSAGPVVIGYGQESGRRPGPDISDPHHQALSPMNWSGFDEERLTKWTALAGFRGAHPAVARGGIDLLQPDPPAFHRGVRIGMATDQVVVASGVEGRTRINVSLVWPDDTVLKDAMTGKMAFVSFGQVSISPHPSGLVLLEEVVE